jgi:hypothetical protein
MLGYERENDVGDLREFVVNVISNNICALA